MRSLIAALVLITLIGIGIVLYERTGRTLSAEGSATTTASFATSTIKESTAAYTIDVSYPQLGIPKLDREIKGAVQGDVSQFKQDATGAPASPAGAQDELSIGIASVYRDPHVVSVVLQGDAYTGGAHGMPYLAAFNFDPTTDRDITLPEALSMIGLTLDQVSQKTIADLTKELSNDAGESAIFADGASPKPENYATFRIDKTHVTFMFQPYQVAPYAAGEPEVSFTRVR